MSSRVEPSGSSDINQARSATAEAHKASDRSPRGVSPKSGFRGVLDDQGRRRRASDAEPRGRRTPRTSAKDARFEESAFLVNPLLVAPPRGTPLPAQSHAGASAGTETAALVERFVESLRVGRVGLAGRLGREVYCAQLRLAVPNEGARETCEVRLVVDGERVSATIAGPRREASEAMARRIEVALRARGIDVENIDVEGIDVEGIGMNVAR